MAIKSFRDLEVYQESLQLAKEVNDLVKGFPLAAKLSSLKDNWQNYLK